MEQSPPRTPGLGRRRGALRCWRRGGGSLEKRYTYAQAGVREYWVADPDSGRVELYVVEGDRLVLVASGHERGRIRSRLIPGLEADLGELFRDL